jgi:redox-sensitive bicupin YhaK (pirin superfamily)
MIIVRPANARGHADYGWLKTWHSFSFADYYDPAEMGWGALRVINEDIVAPGQGFPMHGHRDMEIVTVILSGALEHRDSMGNGEVIRPGEIQRMSAGTGVRHSEFNPSPSEPTHLLQIWLQPAVAGRTPGYEQRTIAAKPGFVWLASPDGREGSATLGQDATLQRGRLAAGERAVTAVAPDRHGYVHVIDGALSVNGVALSRGDGAKLRGETQLEFVADTDADYLLFDTP